VNGSTFSKAFHDTERILAVEIEEPMSVSPGVLVGYHRISAHGSPPGTRLLDLAKVVCGWRGRRPPDLQTNSK
jgi:fatty-acid desaturase